MRICGPKISICGLVTSAWGILMLALMGVFFKIHSVALVEDLSVDEIKRETQSVAEYMNSMNAAYLRNAYSCWTAACLYIITFAFSLQQYCTNRGSHSSM